MAQNDPEISSGKKLGTIALTALVVGAIIGSGIFNLPQNMAENAGAGAIIIAWVITFIGMFTLSKLFEWLSLNRQEIDDGVYGYAKAGFGRYMGFNSAWGYWISIWVGCGVGYLVMFFGTLGSFEPLAFFGKGDTPVALIFELVIIWVLHFFVLRGIQSATFINAIITIAKILPILFFIVCALLVFNIDTFKFDFWGNLNPNLPSLLDQIRSTMLFTVWVFLGIECATVYTTRAKDSKTVSRATIYGFIITFLLLSSVSILSLGVIPQEQLAQLDTPSMAGVIEIATGSKQAALLVKIGVLISLSGAMLAWTLISTEMLYLSGRGKDHTMPKRFGVLNSVGSPEPVLWLTNICVSLVLIYNCMNSSGYNKLIQLASSMALIPYWLCAAYALRTMLKNPPQQRKKLMLFAAGLGTVYSTWLIYAGGMKYLLLSMILYTPGVLLYLKASKEAALSPFPTITSKIVVAIIVVLGVGAAVALAIGKLSL